MKADGAHHGQSQEEPNFVTDNSSLKKKNNYIFTVKTNGLPGRCGDRMPPVLLYFVTVRGFLAQTSKSGIQLTALNGVNSACAKGAHPDSRNSK